MTKRIRFLAILILMGLAFYGCRDWEYNIEKNGILFKKIYQSRDGAVGYMTEGHTIQGFPCEKGWIHFKEDWELQSFQLSQDFNYKGTLLPARTWLHFPSGDPRTGYICSFPYDYSVQGHVCGGSGGFKGIQTGFYNSGRLRSFFPPEDVMVDGVPCEASLFANVDLYENGNLKGCKLAEDYLLEGKKYKKGKTIQFDNSGAIKESP